MTKKILLLGSGELGKEFVIAAKRLGQYVIACDSYAGAPAMQVADACEVFSMLDGLQNIVPILLFLRLRLFVQNVFFIWRKKVFRLFQVQEP